MRGRKPVPPAIKKLRGTLKKSRINTHEPIPPAGDLKPPGHFDDSRLELWHYFVDAAPEGLLTPLDAPVLGLLVDALAEHRIAAAGIAKEGSVITTPSGRLMQNPRVALLNRCALLTLKAAAELGMTPATRGRIAAPLEKPKPSDPWLRLLEP